MATIIITAGQHTLQEDGHLCYYSVYITVFVSNPEARKGSIMVRREVLKNLSIKTAVDYTENNYHIKARRNSSHLINNLDLIG